MLKQYYVNKKEHNSLKSIEKINFFDFKGDSVYMYEKESINIGEKIHKYRKLKKMTLEQLGKKICKSKATVQKYEKNEILPDIYVLVDICNVLGININQLVTRKIIPLDTKSRSNNIFNTDKMHMYYLTDDKMITSVLDVYKDDETYKVRCYNGFNKIKVIAI